MFIIIGAVIFGAVGYIYHRRIVNNQKSRYKEQLVRGIAKNITIAPTAGMVDPEQVCSFFNRITGLIKSIATHSLIAFVSIDKSKLSTSCTFS